LNLDIDLRYHGTPMEFPATRPTEADLLKDEKTIVRLSGFMIMQYADTVRFDLKDDLCHVQLHFDH